MSEAKYIEIEQLDLDLISISPEEDETLPTNPDLDSDQYGKAKASDIPTKQISALTIHVPDTLSKQVSALQLPDATAKHITNNHTIPLTQIQESGDDTSISSFSSDIETKPNSMTIVDRTSPKKKIENFTDIINFTSLPFLVKLISSHDTLCKIVKKINSIYDTPQVFDVKISYSFKTKKYEYDHNGKIYAALKYIPKTFDQLVEDELIEMKTNKYIEQYSSIEGSCYSIIGTNIWCLFNNDDMYTGLIYDSSKDTIFGYYNTKTDTITKKYLNEKIFEFGYEGFHVTQYENKLIIQDLEKDVTITIDNWIYDISKTILLLKGQFDKNLKVKMTAFGKNNMYMLYDYLYINNMYICRFSFSLKQLRTYYETMKNGYLGNPTYRY